MIRGGGERGDAAKRRGELCAWNFFWVVAAAAVVKGGNGNAFEMHLGRKSLRKQFNKLPPTYSI